MKFLDRGAVGGEQSSHRLDLGRSADFMMMNFVVTDARTGVEMEAMVAVSAAALTIYDMAKAIDRAMEIGAIRLVAKRGGRGGDYVWRARRPAPLL